MYGRHPRFPRGRHGDRSEPDTRTNYFVDLYGGTFNEGDTDATLRTNTATDSLSTRIEDLDTSGCTESYTVEVYTKRGPTKTILRTRTITIADFACNLDDSAVYVSQEGCTLTLASRTSDTETVVLESTNPQGRTQRHTISVPGCENTTFQLNPKRGQYTLVESSTTASIEGVLLRTSAEGTQTVPLVGSLPLSPLKASKKMALSG